MRSHAEVDDDVAAAAWYIALSVSVVRVLVVSPCNSSSSRFRYLLPQYAAGSTIRSKYDLGLYPDVRLTHAQCCSANMMDFILAQIRTKMFLKDAETENILTRGTWICPMDLDVIADIIACAIVVHSPEGLTVHTPRFLFDFGWRLIHIKLYMSLDNTYHAVPFRTYGWPV